MNHQDWKPVILKKTQAQLHEMRSKQNKNTKVLNSKKPNSNTANINARKLDEADIPVLKYVPKNIAKEIQQARTLKKMSQQDLATRLSVKKNIINDLETGKILNDKQFISKVKRVLGLIK